MAQKSRKRAPETRRKSAARSATLRKPPARSTTRAKAPARPAARVATVAKAAPASKPKPAARAATAVAPPPAKPIAAKVVPAASPPPAAKTAGKPAAPAAGKAVAGKVAPVAPPAKGAPATKGAPAAKVAPPVKGAPVAKGAPAGKAPAAKPPARPPTPRVPPPPPIPPNELLFDKAQRAMRHGDDAMAERLLERMVVEFPDDLRGRVFLGNVKKKRGDVKGALEEYQKALRKDSANPLALWFKAELHLHERPEPDFASAIACYKKIITKHARRKEAVSRQYAERARSQVQFCEARKLSLKSRRFLQADDTRRLKVARDLLAKALSIYPEDPRNHMNLGVAHLRLGDAEEAVAHTNAAIKLNPQYARAWLMLGQALFKLGKLKHARDAYLKCIELDHSGRDSQDAWIHRRNVEQEIARQRLRLFRALSGVPGPDGQMVKLTLSQMKQLVTVLEGDDIEGADITLAQRGGYVLTCYSQRSRYRILPGPEGLVIERDLLGPTS